MNITKILTNIFSIYWKKNLLFLILFIFSNFLRIGPLSSCISCLDYGFPFKYYTSFWEIHHFYPLVFIFDLILWYIVAGIIIKKPLKVKSEDISINEEEKSIPILQKKIIIPMCILNYSTLLIILIFLFFHIRSCI